jgi:copper homeostasis protein (lipoprotein)
VDRIRRRLSWSIVLVAFAGCSAPSPQPPAVGADNSRNALDWQGVYVGTTPCADCEGIRTRVELRADGTFSRSLTYLGRNEQPFDDTGRFTWDASGSRIALGNARETQAYQVGENVLFHLDRDGQRITGERAAAYRLDKLVNDRRVEDRRWELIELNGQPVQPAAGREGAFLELDAAERRATGNASCNRFFGAYELTAGNRLRFAPNLASTLMACPELERERAFLDVLARVDNYTFADGVLSLNRARMAPLARFRAGGE